MISSRQEELIRRMEWKGPRGGAHFVPDAERLTELLRTFKYSDEDLRIIEANIERAREEAQRRPVRIEEPDLFAVGA